MVITVSQLGLAAYISMQGCKLVKVENKVFYFESEKPTLEWRAEYANSESMRHDAIVCDFREFMRA